MENEIIENENKNKKSLKSEIKKGNDSNSKILNIFKCKKCTDYVTLEINPYNFSASYECDNGDIEEDIYFGTINQFISQQKYEDELERTCVNCNSSNLKKKEESGLEYFAYCKACKIHLCPLCVGNHLKLKKKNHDIIFLGNLAPSDEDIEEAKKSLNDRINADFEIIKKIEKIKNKIVFISNRVIEILREEIKLTSNFINNFHKDIQNYHYLMNFHNINEYILNNKNEKLNKFYQESDFSKQIDSLIEISKDLDIRGKEMEEEIIFNNIKKIETFDKFIENPFGEFKFTTFVGVEFAKKDNNFILAYDSSLKFFHLLRNNNIYLDYDYTFKSSINSILLSKDEEELFISENFLIYIFTYNKKENRYIKPIGDEETSNDILTYQGNKKFNKIFQLDNGKLITVSDDSKLYVWYKNNTEILKKTKNKRYYINKVIPSQWGCYEFLQVNDFYFVILMRDCILKFYDTEEINEIKVLKIKYGDYLREKYNHIVKINKDYLIVGVKSIYVLISIKTMEIVYYYNLVTIKNIISIHKYDYDNFVLFIGKPNDEENVIYQLRFDEDIKELVEISNFRNKIEKNGDCKYNLLNNNMIVRYYYYYSTVTNKKLELFI